MRDAVSFDAVGRIAERLAPYEGTSGLDTYEPPGAGLPGIQLQHDVVDRVTRTTYADGTWRETVHGVNRAISIRHPHMAWQPR